MVYSVFSKNFLNDSFKKQEPSSLALLYRRYKVFYHLIASISSLSMNFICKGLVIVEVFFIAKKKKICRVEEIFVFMITR